ncbi:hypothetical protein K501DRAFT_278963 [Backusella circina FSU 941]|nr:hypothetical protein K501DRAFT_278963 [Backusella circina FSU 941]
MQQYPDYISQQKNRQEFKEHSASIYFANLNTTTNLTCPARSLTFISKSRSSDNNCTLRFGRKEFNVTTSSSNIYKPIHYPITNLTDGSSSRTGTVLLLHYVSQKKNSYLSSHVRLSSATSASLSSFVFEPTIITVFSNRFDLRRSHKMFIPLTVQYVNMEKH